VLLQNTMSAMYRWHNYGKSTIGARSDIENVDIARLQAFYRRYYQPDNATLIVAGKFDRAQVLDWVARSFGPIPRPQRVLERTYTLDPVQDGERQVTVRRVGGTPALYVGYHVVPASHPDFAAVQLLAQVLGDVPAGRLHRNLVQRQLVASAFAFAWGLAEPGPLFLGAQLAPGQDLEAARAALLATVDALATEPVTAEELERARTQWLNDWERGFTDPERIGVQLSNAIALGDWRLYFWQRDRLRAVTLADVQRVAAQYLRRDNRTVGVYLPSDRPERAPEPQRVDVAALLKDYRGDPAAAQAEAFDPTPANLMARTQTFNLASGLQAALLPQGTRGRIVQARLRLHFGDADSLRGEQAVASFAAALIDKGGAGLTRQQIRDRFDALRADVGFTAGGQTLTVSLTTVREHVPEALRLIGRLLREPAFPADALEEVRRQRLAALESQRKEPGALIGMELGRHGNPYPRGDLRHVPDIDERKEDVQSVSVERVRAFHRRFLSAAHGEFAAVGDLDVDAVRGALDSALGDWRAPVDGARAYVRAPDPPVEVPPARFVIATPDRPNANLLATLALPVSDADPEYPALLMANHLFGGHTSSRLWDRVREREGLSYDVRSVIDWNPREPNSRLAVSAIFAPQNRARVEAAVREEIERARLEGFTQAELDRARDGLLRLRRLARAQTGVVASQLAANLELGRSFALSQQVDDAIAALTLEQVNAALRKHIDPARWSIAWGGDFASP
jgi:zinc protease